VPCELIDSEDFVGGDTAGGTWDPEQMVLWSVFQQLVGAADTPGADDSSAPGQSGCSISLWQRPTPSFAPVGVHTYLYVTGPGYPSYYDSDAAAEVAGGLMLEGGPQNPGLFNLSPLIGYVNSPGQGLAKGKWNASNPLSPVN
jgi:hypothetical protein